MVIFVCSSVLVGSGCAGACHNSSTWKKDRCNCEASLVYIVRDPDQPGLLRESLVRQPWPPSHGTTQLQLWCKWSVEGHKQLYRTPITQACFPADKAITWNQAKNSHFRGRERTDLSPQFILFQFLHQIHRLTTQSTSFYPCPRCQKDKDKTSRWPAPQMRAQGGSQLGAGIAQASWNPYRWQKSMPAHSRVTRIHWG